MRRLPNVGLLLAHRLRRWPNSQPTLGQRLIFAGNVISWHVYTLYKNWCINCVALELVYFVSSFREKVNTLAKLTLHRFTSFKGHNLDRFDVLHDMFCIIVDIINIIKKHKCELFIF